MDTDEEPLEPEQQGLACTLCRCVAVVRLYGFRVCEYHRTHTEDDPICPNCHPAP